MALEHQSGHDASAVRLHLGADATAGARALGARATTRGEAILLGQGEYRPGHPDYRRLLAHEFVHVLQQRGAAAAAPQAVASDTDGVEQEARRLSSTAAPAPWRVTPHSLQWMRSTVVEAPTSVTHSLSDAVLADAGYIGFDFIKINGTYVNRPGDSVSTAGGTAPANAAKEFAALSLRQPTLAFEPVAESVTGEIQLRVAGVPENRLSNEVLTLTPPAWTSHTTRAAVGKVVPTLRQCSGADPCRFTAHGLPKDEVLQTATLAHENAHAAGTVRAFQASVEPWDRKLQEIVNNGQVFKGTKSAALGQLWAQVGGRAGQIAEAFIDAVVAEGNALHGAIGEPRAHAINPTAAPDCSSASVEILGGK